MLEKGGLHPVGYHFTPLLPAQVNPHKPACVMENIREHVFQPKTQAAIQLPSPAFQGVLLLTQNMAFILGFLKPAV